MSRPTSLSSTSSLVVPTSGCSSTNGGCPDSQTVDTSQEVYGLSNPDLETPQRDGYTTSAYAKSNPDSEHSLEDVEYRQPTGVYAMSNPDSELSHEEFEYDPRFDYGENTYPISNPDDEVSLEGFAYDPSFDGMQLY